ncbi:hypothetical protein CDL15_Pgr004332 [Punica granatum]|uniref:Uncharacterized protein n=1 Tax=Punica granatum TaxID=22663 RepID=A0A218XHF9_PUNGR|nr:hypothetical protein CDL15_Pgr004332 [Punica granatum]PKI54750.1 hypothetical protein CRG98_024852 [Punica granatum]
MGCLVGWSPDSIPAQFRPELKRPHLVTLWAPNCNPNSAPILYRCRFASLLTMVGFAILFRSELVLIETPIYPSTSFNFQKLPPPTTLIHQNCRHYPAAAAVVAAPPPPTEKLQPSVFQPVWARRGQIWPFRCQISPREPRAKPRVASSSRGHCLEPMRLVAGSERARPRVVGANYNLRLGLTSTGDHGTRSPSPRTRLFESSATFEQW